MIWPIWSVDGTTVIGSFERSATTLTRWDLAGRVVEQRPLTAAELASLTPPPDPTADLLARAKAATTVAALRAVLIDALTEGAI